VTVRALLCVCALLAGGLAPSLAYDRSAIDSRRVSAPAEELLRGHGLTKIARKDPVRAIQLLAELTGERAGDDPAVASTVAELAILAAKSRDASWSPERKLGAYLCAVEHVRPHAIAALANVPAEPPLVVTLHNHALARLVGNLQLVTSSPGEPVALDGPLGGYALQWERAKAPTWSAATHYLRPADEVRTERFRDRVTSTGLGAPLVAIRKGDIPTRVRPERGWFPSYEHFYPLTAVLDLERPKRGGPHATVRLIDPLVQERIKVDGRKVPVAADFTAQLAVLVETVERSGRSRGGIFRAAKYLDETALFLLEPPRRDKIPVVFVHGLKSQAATWADMFNVLRNDPEIRRRYQFWFFDYPTGVPFTYSATLLRRSLRHLTEDVFDGRSGDKLGRTVLIGHSMGGLVSRLQVTDAGTALWDALFTRPVAALELTEADAALAREVYHFDANPSVGRVVFIATPHRGSPVAAGVIGRMGASLVRLPPELREAAERVIEANREHLTPGAAERLRMPDGVETLDPDDVIVKALGGLPIARGLPFHSILGDKGDGDGKSSSDGVVPYWSSHLEGAASERIVPAGHRAHVHPEAIEEVRRILLVHLDGGRGR
jgi:pimeloyl-ACP methyl ester carboxylesterase